MPYFILVSEQIDFGIAEIIYTYKISSFTNSTALSCARKFNFKGTCGDACMHPITYKYRTRYRIFDLLLSSPRAW